MDHPQMRVDHTGDRPAVVKQASTGPAADRLRSEITALQAAQHPGVVTFTSCSDDATGVELRTRFCGSRTLANTSQMPVERVAGTVAALATTVADLHQLGITHGRITADHVLISSDGRPVLCGLAEARLQAGGEDRSHDVALLGVLLRDLLAPHDNVAPIPDSRLGRRASWSGYHRRALLNLADQATADDPLIRPTARQFAHNIRATVPGADLLGHDPSRAGSDLPFAATDGPRSPWPPPHRRSGPGEPSGGRVTGAARRAWSSDRLATVGAGAAAVILAATLAVAAAAPGGGPAPAEPPASEATATTSPGTITATTPRLTTTIPTPTTTAPTVATDTSDDQTPPAPEGARPVGVAASSTIAGAAGCSTVSGAEAATLASGAPCPVPLALDDGVLAIGDERFELGLADAAVAVGDFSCTGIAHAAVLDRTRGDVFVFRRWASPDQPTTAGAQQRIESGSRLLAEPGLEGCHRLVVLDTFGIRHPIETDHREIP